MDLSLEGPAWKISRRQGTIRLRNNGDFFISSEGKRPIFVDSRPILAGNKMKLNNNSVIEVIIQIIILFLFLLNTNKFLYFEDRWSSIHIFNKSRFNISNTPGNS